MSVYRQRKNLRLKGADYSQNGYYFVTICTQGRIELFGQIAVGAIHESPKCAESPSNIKMSNIESDVPTDTVGAIHESPKCTESPQCTKSSDLVESPASIMKLNQNGKILLSIIKDVENHYENIVIDMFCIMPNHVHLIVTICETRAIHESPLHNASHLYNENELYPHTRTVLSKVVGFIKMNASKQIRLAENAYIDVWQRGYYDRIIRNSDEYNAIQEYISTNSLRWQVDTEHDKESIH